MSKKKKYQLFWLIIQGIISISLVFFAGLLYYMYSGDSYEDPEGLKYGFSTALLIFTSFAPLLWILVLIKYLRERQREEIIYENKTIKPMLPLGIVFIFLALILYTVVIWTEKFSKKLRPWMIVLFALAFTCDLIGTGTMFFVAEVKFSKNIHSYAGYFALLVMFAHLIWALSSIKKESRAKYFNKYSIFAWIFWLVAFWTGMPKR